MILVSALGVNPDPFLILNYYLSAGLLGQG